MIKHELIIKSIKETYDYESKNRWLSLLLAAITGKKMKLSKNDKVFLRSFIYEEMISIPDIVESTQGYKAKSRIFKYADSLFGLIMSVYKGPLEITPQVFTALNAVSVLLEKEMYLERRIDNIFAQDIISVQDVDDLIKMLRETDDEYAKGLLYPGLIHYRNKITNMLESSKKLMSDYIAEELAKYIDEYDPANEDRTNALESACEACYFFFNESIESCIRRVPELGNNCLTFYSALTLLRAEKELPAETVSLLANDLVYADGIYHALKQNGKEELFPKELASEEYLAKSDLVHWLSYPTELGKVPDEIEYLGKTTVKKETFYIFRYRSDSDNLEEKLKNKWLIGWSGSDGGTFSNFDEYANYEKSTAEKTVSYIKKKIL